MEKVAKTQSLEKNVTDFAEIVINECKKFYKPGTAPVRKKTEAVKNVVCLRTIQFKQDNVCGFVNVVKIIMMIRTELKKLAYGKAFINALTVSLAQGFLIKR